MNYFNDIRDGRQLANFVTRHAPQAVTLALTEQELPILAVKLGGDKLPAIVIKAGSHASEIGAIHGALTLLAEGIASGHQVWLLPCASPFDFGGYNRALSWAAGKELVLHNDAECREVLARIGRCVYEREHVALFRVGEMIFAAVNQQEVDPRALAYGQLDTLSRGDARLAWELAGRRIFLPNFVYHAEDYTSYDHAGLACWANWDGWVGNLNRFYDSYAPPVEVRGVRDFCEQIKPGLVLDLHESGVIRGLQEAGRTAAGGAMAQQHYLVLPPVHGPCFETFETPVAEAMIEATRQAGFACLDRETLARSWGFGACNYFHGYVRNDQRPIVPFFQWGTRYEASIVVETGMAQPVATRAAIQAAAVRGAVAAYEKLKAR